MGYIFPTLNLLKKTVHDRDVSDKRIRVMQETILDVLRMFKCEARIDSYQITPFSICFDVEPLPGQSIKDIHKMKVDLEVHLGREIEIEDAVQGKTSVMIMVLRRTDRIIGLRNLIESEEFVNAKSPLTVAAGYSYNGKPLIIDIEQLPHMLIAGSTGSGKTVFMDDIITSLMYKATPEEVGLILIDPKIVDFAYYNDIPHLLAPVIYEEAQIFASLDWVEAEMSRRYEIFGAEGVKNIQAYYDKYSERVMQQIVVIIDEYSELMINYRTQVESIVDRISRIGRAAGVHLIIATQRSTSDVITGSIKANIPCRTSFTVVDSRESSAIINRTGAQKLRGSGDMLFSVNNSADVQHAQAAYISETEIKGVVRFLKRNNKVDKKRFK
ncbi:MAG: DUF87 domain-containing protein [Lachnospiraceae bacterium]|nr:DUF87 domain-containing protein [Candidatus Colinaster scatohippi]